MKRFFKHLVVLGLPASGKSEFIDFIKKFSDEERKEKYHIGRFEEIDDFVWIWEKFIEDNIWEAAGYPRKYSEEYMKNNAGLKPEGGKVFDFCLEKFNRDIDRLYLSQPEFYNENTLIIEFSRGGKFGYRHSLERIKPEIWNQAAILFIDVSNEEAWRRNVKRYEEKKRHSILAHMVPKETFDCFYREHDWKEITEDKESGYIEIHDVQVPFVTMNNEPELPPGYEIGIRYKEALDKLFELTGK